jgi:hypothetical protein
VKAFSPSESAAKLVQRKSVDGIVPIISIRVRSKISKLVKTPISVGMVVSVKLVEDRRSILSMESDAMSGESDPERAVKLRSRYSSPDSAQNCDGIDPDTSEEERSIVISLSN